MAGASTRVHKILKIVLKADTEGSLKAVRQAIEKIESVEVRPKIIHAAVGGVTETDVMMAAEVRELFSDFMFWFLQECVVSLKRKKWKCKITKSFISLWTIFVKFSLGFGARGCGRSCWSARHKTNFLHEKENDDCRMSCSERVCGKWIICSYFSW